MSRVSFGLERFPFRFPTNPSPRFTIAKLRNSEALKIGEIGNGGIELAITGPAPRTHLPVVPEARMAALRPLSDPLAAFSVPRRPIYPGLLPAPYRVLEGPSRRCHRF